MALGVSRQPLGSDMDQAVSHQPLAMDQAVSHQPLAMDQAVSHQPLAMDQAVSHNLLPWIRRLVTNLLPWIRRLVTNLLPWIRRLVTSLLPWIRRLVTSILPWIRRLVACLSPRGSNSIPGQSMWDLWWTQWHWAGIYPSTSVSPVRTIPPLLHTHSLIYRRLCITTATGGGDGTHKFRSHYFSSFQS